MKKKLWQLIEAAGGSKEHHARKDAFIDEILDQKSKWTLTIDEFNARANIKSIVS